MEMERDLLNETSARENLVQAVTIIGIGLIGGSFALSLRREGYTSHIVGVDNSEQHLKSALELKLIDEVLPLNDAIAKSGLIVLAIPVDATVKLLPLILDQINGEQVFGFAASSSKTFTTWG